jgi:hypothetical protein
VHFGADAEGLPPAGALTNGAAGGSSAADGQLPLHVASVNGHLEVVEYLVQRAGANPCAIDSRGQTAAR